MNGEVKSCLLVLTACWMFIGGGFLVRFVAVGPFEVNLIRAILLTIFLLPFVIQSKCPLWNIEQRLVILNLIQGVINAFGLSLLFYAVINMPFGESIVLLKLSIILTPFTSWVINREQPSVRDFPSIFLGIIGTILIMQPEFIFQNKKTSTVNYPNLAFGRIAILISAVFNAFCSSLVREIKGRLHWSYVTLSSSIFNIVVSAIIVPFLERYQLPQCFGVSRYFFVLLGLSQVIGSYGYVRAHSYTTPARIQCMMTVDVLISYILQLSFFPEDELNAYGGAGSMCVILAAMLAIFGGADIKKKLQKMIFYRRNS